ncbi:MAG: thiazole biosynthesis adenylyltransferase ThiF [Planctomycetota bacterium]|nr:MAG: thiazole biosynthesis adenylyltransferase ThiF [Planctomycetota bacterium]
MSGKAEQNLDRYVRQMRYAPLGEEGQRKIASSRALICGCGALGSVLANTLARAGVGLLRIVDRDFLELNNLQRQVLYDEEDVAAGLPKAIAAANKLRRINSQIEIEPVVVDVDHTNVLQLAEGMDVLVDGTDNFETRMLVNEASDKLDIPWVYGGCIGAEGQVMTVLPGETPCLRSIMSEPPPPGTSPTCDTAGILGGIVNVVASLQATEAMKILSGHREAINRTLTVVDLWENRIRQIQLDSLAPGPEGSISRRENYPWLSGARTSQSAILCGRNAVQLSAAGEGVPLDKLAEKLDGVGEVTQNAFLMRLAVDNYQITVFPDGRTIIGGTDDIAEARSVHAKYIGS